MIQYGTLEYFVYGHAFGLQGFQAAPLQLWREKLLQGIIDVGQYAIGLCMMFQVYFNANGYLFYLDRPDVDVVFAEVAVLIKPLIGLFYQVFDVLYLGQVVPGR